MLLNNNNYWHTLNSRNGAIMATTMAAPLSLKWTFHQSHRLLDFGFTGELWACFQAYLSSRRQCVRVEDTSSDFLPVLSGVPQGSIIGPLLFIIYINDLSTGDCLPSNLLLLADDSKCFNRISSTVDCLILQEIINDVILVGVMSRIWILMSARYL